MHPNTMKIELLTSLLLITATLAWAVPSEINYQGRLMDANGDAVTGDVTMSLKMFDAATDGNEIYSEDIGTVTLDSNGIYSFEFGANGQSVVSTSESIATTDGISSIFNTTLENLPVDGSVSISDGTYTWSQSNGSSSSTEFTATVTPSSGAVSAIYLNGAPTSNVDITASYNYMDATLSGALSSHASHWLELSVDGTAQSPRERVLSVPFAQLAGSALNTQVKRNYPCSTGWFIKEGNYTSFADLPLQLPQYNQPENYGAFFYPNFSAKVKSIKSVNVTLGSGSNSGAKFYLYAVDSYTNERTTLAYFMIPSYPANTQQDYSSEEITLDTEKYSYYMSVTNGSLAR